MRTENLGFGLTPTLWPKKSQSSTLNIFVDWSGDVIDACTLQQGIAIVQYMVIVYHRMHMTPPPLRFFPERTSYSSSEAEVRWMLTVVSY